MENETEIKILLTNDDGIRAEGLISLARAMSGLGDIVVVAPASQQSAVGHSITLHKPLRCIPEPDFPVKNIRVFSTNGTPTDSVLLGIHGIFGEKPDIVISGINSGPNLGYDVTYSGTVAGAMEGVVAGIPSISVSMGAFENIDYDGCARFIRKLTKLVVASNFKSVVLLNVNYPNLPEESINGVAVTRLGQRWYDDVLHKRVDPRGREYFWVTGKSVSACSQPDTDACELERGFISITPLSLDMTDTQSMDEIAGILTDSFVGK
ncbi:MAG TPA: 5'/3'-nucleotidase SurE [Firmicutes bacterium]|nr:5'/3'-nucleotidase SurE [Bacillota bacterium]